MKVLLRIFIPLCVVSFIAFGISVAIFGTNQELLEAGAQTNTVQEVKNAMEPFADILNRVLKGCGTG